MTSEKARGLLARVGHEVARVHVGRVLPGGAEGGFLAVPLERERSDLDDTDRSFQGFPRPRVPLAAEDVGGLEAWRAVVDGRVCGRAVLSRWSTGTATVLTGAHRWLAKTLAGIGRHATRFLAAGIFLGVLVPPLAAAARPLLTPAIFLLIVVTVLRLDSRAVAASFGRPLPLVLAVVWVLAGAPLLVVPLARVAGGDGILVDHAVLVAASAPVISAVAYAVLLGLDAGFALTVGVVATALVPFTLPLLAGVLLGVDLPLEPTTLLMRLALLIGGATAAAVGLRRWWEPAVVARRGAAIDGVAVLAMLTFGLAVMDGVTAAALNRPAFTAMAVAAVFALAIGLNIAGTLLFAPFGRRLAMTVGLMSGFKNFGVVVAAMGAAADDVTVVFLGLVQFPIYLMPLALRTLARRRLAREGGTP